MNPSKPLEQRIAEQKANLERIDEQKLRVLAIALNDYKIGTLEELQQSVRAYTDLSDLYLRKQRQYDIENRKYKGG